MNKRAWLTLIPIVILFLLLANRQDKAQEAPPAAEHKVVGAQKCKLCHSSEKMGGTAFKTWSGAKHSQAFAALSSEKGLAAAKELDIDDPAKSERCTKCHVTSAEFPEEGVSCERCHGGAEQWLKPHGSLKAENRSSREENVAMGLKPLWEKEVREALCMECHREDPDNKFYKPFNYDEYWAKIDHGKKNSE